MHFHFGFEADHLNSIVVINCLQQDVITWTGISTVYIQTTHSAMLEGFSPTQDIPKAPERQFPL